jgi:isoamylase
VAAGKIPILRRNLFLNGVHQKDLNARDVTWINAGGVQMAEEDWHDPALRCYGMLLDGRAQTPGIGQGAKEATILVFMNGGGDAMPFTLSGCVDGCAWSLLIDTSFPEVTKSALFAIGASYTVNGRSLVVFVLRASNRFSWRTPPALH